MEKPANDNRPLISRFRDDMEEITEPSIIDLFESIQEYVSIHGLNKEATKQIQHQKTLLDAQPTSFTQLSQALIGTSKSDWFAAPYYYIALAEKICEVIKSLDDITRSKIARNVLDMAKDFTRLVEFIDGYGSRANDPDSPSDT